MTTENRTLHVSLLAGQSNARGYGLFRDFTGLGVNFAAPVKSIVFAERDYNRNDHTINYDLPLSHLQRSPVFFGPEMSLGRCLNMRRRPEWGASDRVALIKFAAGGSALDEWLQSDTTGLSQEFYSWLSDLMNELESKYEKVVYHDIFWTQGESDSGPINSPTYVTRFAQFMQELQAVCPVQPVYTLLNSDRGTANDPFAAAINQSMIDGGYRTTVSNNDLELTDLIHYNADSVMTLGSRMADAAYG